MKGKPVLTYEEKQKEMNESMTKNKSKFEKAE